jgi:hypothetical protein
MISSEAGDYFYQTQKITPKVQLYPGQNIASSNNNRRRV